MAQANAAPKAQATRPYAVFDDGKMVALIRTSSAARAIAAHTAGKYEAHVADPDEIFSGAKAGLEIQDDKSTVQQPGLL